MTRGQRRAHARAWPLIGVVIALVMIGALYERTRIADAAAAFVAPR